MNGSNTYTKKQKTSKNEDLSKNHHRKVRYRIRLQEDEEALDDIKKYQQGRIADVFGEDSDVPPERSVDADFQP